MEGKEIAMKELAIYVVISERNLESKFNMVKRVYNNLDQLIVLDIHVRI